MAFHQDIESALTQPEPMQKVLDLTIRHLNAESGTIHLMGDDGVMHLTVSNGIPEVVLDIVRIIPVGKGMAGLAVERKQPVSVCNLQTDGSGDAKPGARKTGMEGAIVVPVMRGDEAVGALGVANRAERTFTESEIETLMSVGHAIAATVQAKS